MKQERVTLRCEDGAEVAVFEKYTYSDGDINYEFSIEDDYVGGDYKGFFGRIKRAWRAFWDKPVVYTGIYCEDEKKMRKFLCDCLKLADGVSDYSPPYIVTLDDSVTSNEELIKRENSK